MRELVKIIVPTKDGFLDKNFFHLLISGKRMMSEMSSISSLSDEFHNSTPGDISKSLRNIFFLFF